MAQAIGSVGQRTPSGTFSVVIPTLNSEATISRCLESVRAQSLEPKEIIVVDACSTDRTCEISRHFARVVVADSSSTRARLIGCEIATGDYILNLDSDQVLAPDAVRAAFATTKSIVAFGEVSTGVGIVARINRLDKATINRDWERNLDPVSGFIRPRFYRRDVLLRSFRMIPDHILDIRPSPFADDSLLYWHTQVKPVDIGFVPDAVLHEEMSQLFGYVRKWRLYGQTAKPYRGTQYSMFATSRGKRSVRGIRQLATAPGLLLRVVPFFIGYYL
ncbi:MAG: glycosyltransferase family A protein [Thermoplasmata archaeon]